jgi:hypothetical protein
MTTYILVPVGFPTFISMQPFYHTSSPNSLTPIIPKKSNHPKSRSICTLTPTSSKKISLDEFINYFFLNKKVETTLPPLLTRRFELIANTSDSLDDCGRIQFVALFILNPLMHDYFLQKFAIHASLNNRFGKTLLFSNPIHDFYIRDDTLFNSAKNFAKKSNFRDAYQCLKQIKNIPTKDRAYRTYALTLAEMNKLRESVHFAREIKDIFLLKITSQLCTIKLMKKNKFSEVLTLFSPKEKWIQKKSENSSTLTLDVSPLKLPTSSFQKNGIFFSKDFFDYENELYDLAVSKLNDGEIKNSLNIAYLITDPNIRDNLLQSSARILAERIISEDELMSFVNPIEDLTIKNNTIFDCVLTFLDKNEVARALSLILKIEDKNLKNEAYKECRTTVRIAKKN